jgi:hypothetical protein
LTDRGLLGIRFKELELANCSLQLALNKVRRTEPRVAGGWSCFANLSRAEVYLERCVRLGLGLVMVACWSCMLRASCHCMLRGRLRKSRLVEGLNSAVVFILAVRRWNIEGYLVIVWGSFGDSKVWVVCTTCIHSLHNYVVLDTLHNLQYSAQLTLWHLHVRDSNGSKR